MQFFSSSAYRLSATRYIVTAGNGVLHDERIIGRGIFCLFVYNEYSSRIIVLVHKINTVSFLNQRSRYKESRYAKNIHHYQKSFKIHNKLSIV